MNLSPTEREKSTVLTLFLGTNRPPYLNFYNLYMKFSKIIFSPHSIEFLRHITTFLPISTFSTVPTIKTHQYYMKKFKPYLLSDIIIL